MLVDSYLIRSAKAPLTPTDESVAMPPRTQRYDNKEVAASRAVQNTRRSQTLLRPNTAPDPRGETSGARTLDSPRDHSPGQVPVGSRGQSQTAWQRHGPSGAMVTVT